MEERVCLLVLRKRGVVEEERRLIRISKDERVGAIIFMIAGGHDITRVEAAGAENEKMTEVDHDLTVEDITSFGFKVLQIHCKAVPKEVTKMVNSAFDKMMAASKSVSYLPPERSGEKLTAYDRMFNDVIKLLGHEKAGWTAAESKSDICGRFVTALTKALWYLDFHHGKFKDRICEIPDMFKKFTGYFDVKKNKKKDPQLQAMDLKMHIDVLSNLLMQPFMNRTNWKVMSDAIAQLVEAMQKYYTFLLVQQQRNKERHASLEVARNPDINFGLRTIEASTTCLREYEELQQAVEKAGVYIPICLIDYEPADRYERRHWIQSMSLQIPVSMYTYYQGNYLGNLTYLWALPENEDRSEEKQLATIAALQTHFATYSSRAMRRQFLDRYGESTSIKPALLRDIYRFLTEDCSAPETLEEAEVDERAAQFIVNCDDPGLIYDLRKLNGQPGSTKFDVFWAELAKFLDESCIVDERRHGTQLYMPFAISVEDLKEQIVKRVPEGTPIPSTGWIRFQFWPSNPHSKCSTRYTGRFNVKYAVQQRILRLEHPDSKYATFNYKMLKAFAVKWKHHVRFLCLDDKAVVPVGEPRAPVSTGVRPHGKSLVVADPDNANKALDHDFHVCGIIPSVTLNVNVPDDARDSFHSGHVFVSTKDKIFEPSTAARHATEQITLLRSLHSEDDVSLDRAILINFTDGGPDHRTTYISVQLAAIAMFIALNVDLFIHARTAPHGSYLNPAERVMSVLNLALQNVSLSRSGMSNDKEKDMKRCSSIKQVRDVAEKSQAFKESLVQSMEEVITSVDTRFARLKYSENPVNTRKPVGNDVDILNDALHIISPSIYVSTNRKEVEKNPEFKAFMDKHCRMRQYMFQIKKCPLESADNCSFCSMNPPRLPEDVYTDLHFAPDPVLDQSKEHYMPFSEVYGRATSDKDMPSKNGTVKTSTVDKNRKSLLTREKARMYITCAECGKHRVIYSSKKLTPEQRDIIKEVDETSEYICGNPLLPPDHKLVGTVVVRDSLLCSSKIEPQYYSAPGQYYPMICVHCGDDNIDEESPTLKDAAKLYTQVRPICVQCVESGKPLVTRGRLN